MHGDNVSASKACHYLKNILALSNSVLQKTFIIINKNLFKYKKGMGTNMWYLSTIDQICKICMHDMWHLPRYLIGILYYCEKLFLVPI